MLTTLGRTIRKLMPQDELLMLSDFNKGAPRWWSLLVARPTLLKECRSSGPH